jgi:hypothetical protein
MQPLSQVSEREERESSTREYISFKVPREPLQPWAWSIYTPLSRGKNAKSTAVRRPLGRVDCPPGPRGLSTWAPRTVRGQAADRPPSPPSCTLFCLVSRRITDCPHRARALSAWKHIFLENFCQKPQILNKYQKPADRPPREPELSAQHLKADFSYDFQWNPFTKRNRHSSKCNAFKFLIQVALWKVKPMKLIPLDSTVIYPINPLI